jgi:acid stress-induced BolA-like protein IbaG/YrbA
MELEGKIVEILNASGVAIVHSSFDKSDNGNVGGILISGCFEGMDETERQELVWDKLKEKLSAEEQRRIASLITVTPEEEKTYKQQD